MQQIYDILRTMASTIKNVPAPMPGHHKSFMLGVICLLISGAIIVAGLWPFEFNPANKVEWVQNGKGIKFFGQGIILSRDPLMIQGTTSRNASVTIELLVRPHKEINNMVASIFTLYNGNRDQFIVGQWKKELIVRIPAAKNDRHRRYREIGVENVLTRDTTHLITVTSNQVRTSIYIDGKPEKEFRHFSLIPETEQLSGHLVLGNSPDGTNPWNGTLLGAAVYDYILSNKELRDHIHSWQKRGQPFASDEHFSLQDDKPTSLRTSKPIALYLFSEHNNEKISDQAAHNDILIPATFKPLRKTILGMPEKDQWFNRWNLMDIAINIIGFVPFGFCLSAWLIQVKNFSTLRIYGVVLLLGFCLSLAIELTQVYIPMRDSSLLDLFSNVMGAANGTFLLKHALPILRKLKSDRILLL